MFGALRLPSTIMLGCGKRQLIGAAAAGLGENVMICTDARLAQTDEFLQVMADFKSRSVRVRIYDQTIADLPLECVDECVRIARDARPDVVIGIGGGSCIDLNKVVAVLGTHDGDISRFYGEFAVPGPVLPVIAVPTTAGTGSEITPVAVVKDVTRETKIGIASSYVIPRIAICDPELTVTCPRPLDRAAMPAVTKAAQSGRRSDLVDA